MNVLPRQFKSFEYTVLELLYSVSVRVATDLENLENQEKSASLKETSESQGISLKSQGICDRNPKISEFCCLKFIFSQVEDPNFKIFLGKHASKPTKWSWTHNRGYCWSGIKSGNFILSGKWQPCSVQQPPVRKIGL